MGVKIGGPHTALRGAAGRPPPLAVGVGWPEAEAGARWGQGVRNHATGSHVESQTQTQQGVSVTSELQLSWPGT
jgi:hypothetical protein